ncbi:MAG: hypothetical protein ACYC7E_10280 [Armatimonadota bacterium]
MVNCFRTWMLVSICLLLFAAITPAIAGINVIYRPGEMYLRSTHLLPITQANGVPVGELTNGSVAVDFSSNMLAGTVPTCWPAWGVPPDVETATPRVLCSDGETAMRWTFNTPLKIFGVELAPRPPATTATVIVTFYNGSTVVGSISRELESTIDGDCTCNGEADGNGGALLFAAEACDLRFTRVEIESTEPFGAAQVRYATYWGNVLTLNPNTGCLLLGTTNIPKSGWYPLEAPSGAWVYVVTSKVNGIVTGYIKSYDSDGNHASGVTFVRSNSISFVWQNGRLVQRATVYGKSLGAIYYSSTNKTVLGTGETLPGAYALTLTFYDTTNIEKGYREL